MQKIDPKVTEKTFFPDFAPCHKPYIAFYICIGNPISYFFLSAREGGHSMILELYCHIRNKALEKNWKPLSL